MMLKIDDYELADTLASKWPKGKTPIFPVIAKKESREPAGIDFENGPFCVLDETEEDYSLKADSFINDSIPTNTKRAYLGDIQYFTQWATYALVTPVRQMPVKIDGEDILKFVFHHLKEMPKEVEDQLLNKGWKRTRGVHSLATVKRRLISLSILHKFNNLPDPCDSPKVKVFLADMAKTQSEQKKSKAITKNVLENLLATCSNNTLIDIRDKAILLFGWASGGLRRSEISDASTENLEETVEGDFIYRIANSKTDQTGKGNSVPIKGRAAAAIRQWLKASGVTQGMIFRSISKAGKKEANKGCKLGDKITSVDINRIVKKRCALAGYDEQYYTVHSLRRGFITESGNQVGLNWSSS
jgi:integrase